MTDGSWNTIGQIAQAAGKYVFDNFATVTNCGATPTDMCAQQYLTTLAQKTYRRPLTAAEQMRITTLYSTTLKTGAGATINEAVQYGVYAIMQSPQFLYRTEFGTDWKVDGALTPSELASMLSYFLTDNTPDQQLLDAAAQNKLSTPEDVGPHVDRILKTVAAKANLHGAMMSYFSYPNLETVVIQDTGFTGPVAGAGITKRSSSSAIRCGPGRSPNCCWLARPSSVRNWRPSTVSPNSLRLGPCSTRTSSRRSLCRPIEVG